MAVETITSVLVPAGSYDLTDLATAKDELSIPVGDTTQDAFLSRAISQASKVIANFCNRTFAVETLQDQCFIEQDAYPFQVPGGVDVLQLARWPLVNITSLQVVQTLMVGVTRTLAVGTDFVIDAERGWLIRINPFTGTSTRWEAELVTVRYDAGYAPIPFDLVDACLRVVTARFKMRGRDPMLRSEGEPGLGQLNYWVGTMPGQDGSLAPEIAGLLDSYRTPVMA
jgi:hypothetical protein